MRKIRLVEYFEKFTTVNLLLFQSSPSYVFVGVLNTPLPPFCARILFQYFSNVSVCLSVSAIQQVIRILKMIYWNNGLAWNSRSSHPEVFRKKDALKYFAKFAEKYMCWSLFLNKVTNRKPATLLKRNSDSDVLLWILQVYNNTFLIEHVRRLLLKWVTKIDVFFFEENC